MKFYDSRKRQTNGYKNKYREEGVIITMQMQIYVVTIQRREMDL